MASLNDARSYELDPCDRVLTYSGHTPSQSAIRYRGRFCRIVMSQSAVHEHMTAASIREYRDMTIAGREQSAWRLNYMDEDGWWANGREHHTFAIIFGTWWNDDPLMQTTGQGLGFIRGGAHIWSALRAENALYRGGGGRRECWVNGADHLARRSHFGSLQYLHFMTAMDSKNNSQREARVDTTIDVSLKWLHFAFDVATGRTAPGESLTEEMEVDVGLPSLSQNYCEPRKNIKVRTLFSVQGHHWSVRDVRTPDIALGSMLHILQDSFSPSHTCRISEVSGDKEQALLFDVENYAQQVASDHALLDKFPRWFLDNLRNGAHQFENDPVIAGAWLLSAVDRRLEWSEVESYLRRTIFAKAAATGHTSALRCIGRDESTDAEAPHSGNNALH